MVVGVGVCHSSQAPFANVALLTGVGNKEGYRFMSQSDIARSSSADVVDDAEVDDVEEQRWQKTLRTYVQNTYQYHRQKIYDVLDHNYRHLISDDSQTGILDNGAAIGRSKTGQLASPNSPGMGVAADTSQEIVWRPIRNMAELLGDGQYGAPTVALAASHAVCSGSRLGGGAPTFLFNYQSRRSRSRDNNRSDSRAGDRDLLSFLFGAPLVDGLDPFDSTGTGNDRAAESDRTLATALMMYLANFIRSRSVKICFKLSTVRSTSRVSRSSRSHKVLKIIQFSRSENNNPIIHAY